MVNLAQSTTLCFVDDERRRGDTKVITNGSPSRRSPPRYNTATYRLRRCKWLPTGCARILRFALRGSRLLHSA